MISFFLFSSVTPRSCEPNDGLISAGRAPDSRARVRARICACAAWMFTGVCVCVWGGRVEERDRHGRESERERSGGGRADDAEGRKDRGREGSVQRGERAREGRKKKKRREEGERRGGRSHCL